MKRAKTTYVYTYRLFVSGSYVGTYNTRKDAVNEMNHYKTSDKFISCECSELNLSGDVIRIGIGTDKKSARADLTY